MSTMKFVTPYKYHRTSPVPTIKPMIRYSYVNIPVDTQQIDSFTKYNLHNYSNTGKKV